MERCAAAHADSGWIVGVCRASALDRPPTVVICDTASEEPSARRTASAAFPHRTPSVTGVMPAMMRGGRVWTSTPTSRRANMLSGSDPRWAPATPGCASWRCACSAGLPAPCAGTCSSCPARCHRRCRSQCPCRPAPASWGPSPADARPASCSTPTCRPSACWPLTGSSCSWQAGMSGRPCWEASPGAGSSTPLTTPLASSRSGSPGGSPRRRGRCPSRWPTAAKQAVEQVAEKVAARAARARPTSG
jgi:hypothetical protein